MEIIKLIIENWEELNADELELLKEMSIGFEEVNGEFQIFITPIDILDLNNNFERVELVKEKNKIDLFECYRTYLYNDEV